MWVTSTFAFFFANIQHVSPVTIRNKKKLFMNQCMNIMGKKLEDGVWTKPEEASTHESAKTKTYVGNVFVTSDPDL